MATNKIIGIEKQADGSFIEVVKSKQTTFTPPTGNKWYRVIADEKFISGTLKIIVDLPDTKMSATLSINADNINRSNLNLLGYHGSNIVSNVRVARGQSNSGGAVGSYVVVDLLCTDASAGKPITLESEGKFMPDFIDTPFIVGSNNDKLTQDGGIFGSDGAHLANDIKLVGGLITNTKLQMYHGSLADPGSALIAGGRVGYLHQLGLLGGAGNFTAAADHFHLLFKSGTGSQAGFWTPQHIPQSFGVYNDSNINKWSTWQQLVACNGTKNELFAGGVTDVVYAATDLNALNGYKFALDTRSIVLAPSSDFPPAPDYAGEVNFYYRTTAESQINTLSAEYLDVGKYVSVKFQPGVAGIAAAELDGVVTMAPRLTADSFGTGLSSNGTPVEAWQITIKLNGFKQGEFYQAERGLFVEQELGNWKISNVPNPVNIGGQVALSSVDTTYNKFVAHYSTPHNISLGQNVVLRLIGPTWYLNSYDSDSNTIVNAYVSKILDDNKFELTTNIARDNGFGLLRWRAQISPYSSGSPDFVKAGTVILNDAANIPLRTDTIWDDLSGIRVQLLTTGYAPPSGVNLKQDYWIRNTTTNSNISFFNSLSDASANLHGKVQVQVNPMTYGVNYLRVMDRPALGATGWSVSIGSTDPGHSQTASDCGWRLSRNIYPGVSGSGIAQGVITRGAFGGMNDYDMMSKAVFSYGWNCTTLADYTVAFGQNIENVTTQSTEIGTNDNLKIRFKDNDINVISNLTTSVFQISANGELGTTSSALSSNGVDTYLKIKNMSDDTQYGLKLYPLS